MGLSPLLSAIKSNSQGAGAGKVTGLPTLFAPEGRGSSVTELPVFSVRFSTDHQCPKVTFAKKTGAVFNGSCPIAVSVRLSLKSGVLRQVAVVVNFPFRNGKQQVFIGEGFSIDGRMPDEVVPVAGQVVSHPAGP